MAPAPAVKLTAKGRATRARIVNAAAELMLEHGVARTTIEDIQQAAAVSTSQMYHYFADKGDLVAAVIDAQSDQVLGGQELELHRVDSIEALCRWRDAMVAGVRGGLLLSQVRRDTTPLEAAVDILIEQLRNLGAH